jgi:pimeloyl-ACP methyl ester carboxylesterase
MPKPTRLAIALLLALVSACDRPAPRSSAPPAPRPTLAASADATPPPPPPPPPPEEPRALTADGPFLALQVEGHGDAVVSLPLGARDKRPLVIATHGNYDRPEWQCEVWREIVHGSAFVLCPRGVSRPDSPSRDDIRFTYASNRALEREIEAAMTALRARFGDHLDDAAPLYTGFSLGAIMGVSIATRAPDRFPRMVLIEGGHDKWTHAAAAAYAKGAPKRVLFVCSQPHCAADAKVAAARLDRAGAAVRVARGPNVGHRYDGPTAEETKRALPWVVEGDARWKTE